MAFLLAEHRMIIVICITLSITFIWLDVALYFHVQNLRPDEGKEGRQGQGHGDGHRGHIYSPFKGLSVKLVMMDPFNNYLFTPLGELFNSITNFSQSFSFVSANFVSLIGLINAFLAAKLVSNESFNVRRVGVLVFQLRTFFDVLDGIVARERNGITKHISQVGTSGYFVDGVCDTIGFTAFLIGVWVYLKKSVPRTCKYIPLDINDKNNSLVQQQQHQQQHVIHQHVIVIKKMPYLTVSFDNITYVTFCFGIQLASSALFWNYFLNKYHNLLENSDNHQDDGKSISIYQIEVMHSSLTWSIMWFWRVLNAHALMQYLLFAVFVNRIWEFLLWAQYTGFISIGTLTFFSQIHVLHVESYLNRNQIKPTSLPDFN